MIEHEVLRVFVGPDGAGGNPLGVVYDGAAVPGETARQELANRLGYSETVFVDDPDRGVVDIYTPGVRLLFAGHPLIGTAWLLRERGHRPDTLRPPAGPVPTWTADGRTWLRADPAWATGRRTEQYASPAEVDALPAPPPGEGWLYAWAWADETAGRVRTRGFPRRPDGVITEDEATGAAAIALTAELRRGLDLRQGAASQLLTRYEDSGLVALGGLVTRV
ncbi:phenazine biosynthesis protein PhzC/PhzF [Kitasatospora sp. MMS16-BH015]|uniref:PhzF family phenazine biosynthesis protein n=1 Tax=Kitasatospora sp. MMS16-BH015 TaxID=2018025 RepID=UPI000CA330D7|nr:PhzF family phenazine biosynthesis protein [Kitasatospora sp. MMS16-BH015]AUG77037.1 phenazine biosynthesis protein PhzC/PhzF [Kitasatospora sp. MMS16-BH015]